MSDELKQKFINKLNGGHRYELRKCSICAYSCKFFAVDNNLFYDAGCYCIMQPPRQQNWLDLDFYLEKGHGHRGRIEQFCEEKYT